MYPLPSMWGFEPRARAQARQVERIVEQRLLNPLIAYVHATNSPTGRPANDHVAQWAAAQWPAALIHLDDLLADGRSFLLGEAVSVADCSLAATLQFARYNNTDLLEGLDALAHWHSQYRARPVARMVLSL